MCPAAYILSVMIMKSFFHSKSLLPLLLSLVGIPAVIRYNSECAKGIEKGIAFCTGVLIPSLFLFMVLTAYLIKSGAALLLAKPFGRLSRIMGLPREASTAILMAMIGGYPIGACCTALLYEEGQLSASEAAKTACIAVAAGPGFLLSYIGRTLLMSRQAGELLLAAQITAVLITGIIVGRFIRCSPPAARRRPHPDSAGALIGAVRSAADATFSMCATVVLFAAIIEMTEAAANPKVSDVASIFLEITTGCSRLCNRIPLYLTAFFIGFGGFSVHCQIFSCLKDIPLNKTLFLFTRVVQGIIAMAATYIFLMITPMETAVFSSSDAPLSAAQSATYAGSGALILLALCFIGSVSSKIRRMKVCAE